MDDDNNNIHLYKESILNEETDLALVKSAIEDLDTDDQELLNLISLPRLQSFRDLRNTEYTTWNCKDKN